jgi:hypothetical protein
LNSFRCLLLTKRREKCRKTKIWKNKKGEKVQEKIEICWKIEMPPKENRKKGIEVTHLLSRGKRNSFIISTSPAI